jgi:hypothetical protein
MPLSPSGLSGCLWAPKMFLAVVSHRHHSLGIGGASRPERTPFGPGGLWDL